MNRIPANHLLIPAGDLLDTIAPARDNTVLKTETLAKTVSSQWAHMHVHMVLYPYRLPVVRYRYRSSSPIVHASDATTPLSRLPEPGILVLVPDTVFGNSSVGYRYCGVKLRAKLAMQGKCRYRHTSAKAPSRGPKHSGYGSITPSWASRQISSMCLSVLPYIQLGLGLPFQVSAPPPQPQVPKPQAGFAPWRDLGLGSPWSRLPSRVLPATALLLLISHRHPYH